VSVPKPKPFAPCVRMMSDTCGMLGTVSEGRRRLCAASGSSFHKGFLCQKVSRYSGPGLSRGSFARPMKRVGPKGKGQFTRITWDEAIDTIARRSKKSPLPRWTSKRFFL